MARKPRKLAPSELPSHPNPGRAELERVMRARADKYITAHGEPATKPKPAAKPPRPTLATKPRVTYTAELGGIICEHLADGLTLRATCRAIRSQYRKWPTLDERTVRRWALDLKHPLSPQYTRARALGYETWQDHLVDTADGDDELNQERLRARLKAAFDGDVAVGEAIADAAAALMDSEQTNRDRLRIETRKWILSKALPKVYGDKLAHTGSSGEGPVEYRNVA